MNLFLFTSGLLVAFVSGNDDPVYDIQFNMPDLVVSPFIVDTGSHRRSTWRCKLEGFKMRRAGTSDSFMWASIGCPTLLKFNGERIFQFGPEDVSAQVRLLTHQQKEALMKEAKRLYNNDPKIVTESFKPMPLQQFSCSIEFQVDGVSHRMNGSVFDFDGDPLTIRFPFGEESEKRQVLKTRLDGKDPVALKCDVASVGKSERMNTLTIKGGEVSNLNVWSNVFGDGGQATLTRNQMQQIAGEIESSLNIEEDYELDNEDFTETFIDQFIKNANAKFQEMPLSQALENLAKYGFNSQDMTPDMVKKQLSHSLIIDKTDSKNHVITNKEHDASGSSDSSMTNDVTANVVGIGDASAKFTKAHKQDWKKSGKSVNDQLNMINSDRQSDVKWEREGDLIVPKSLNVAVVGKTSLQKNLNFKRVKKRVKSAKFARAIDLNARNAMSNWRVQEVIKSVVVTNWGQWGPWDPCPANHYANGFQLKTQSHQGVAFGDDTAVNSIKLFCVSPTAKSTGRSKENTVTSSEGPFGNWGNVFTCPEGEFLNGFRAQVESAGPGDNVGLSNLLMICSNGRELKGDGHDWGGWSSDVKCPVGYICAIQTQVEPNKGMWRDDTALNNVNFQCCDDTDDSKVQQ